MGVCVGGEKERECVRVCVCERERESECVRACESRKSAQIV